MSVCFICRGNANSSLRNDGIRSLLRLLALVVLVSVSTVAVPAFAQAAGVSATGEQRGVRVGGLSFWPALFLEGRYDSNVFRENEVENPVAAPMLRIRPGLSFSNKKGRSYVARFGVIGDIRVYMSDNENVKAQGRYGAEGQAGIDFMPKGLLKIGLFDNFKRHLDSPTTATNRTMDGIDNTAGVRFSLRPGGTELRKPLNFTVGYANRLQVFDEAEDLNAAEHRAFFKFVWLFLPKTSLVFDGSYAYYGYAAEGARPGPDLHNSTPSRFMAGIDGLITRKLAVVLKGGYGMSGHSEGDVYEDYLAQTTLVFSPSATSVFSTGWVRNFRNSPVGNFLATHDFKVQGDIRMMQRVQTQLMATYSLVDYGKYDPIAEGDNVEVTPENGLRADQVLRLSATAGFDIFRFIGVSLGYNLEQLASNYELRPLPDPVTGLKGKDDYASYVRHIVFASLDIRY